MSIMTDKRDAAYEYAYTRADQQNETVIIYVRYITGDEGDEVVPQYIATGTESDVPPGATIETIIDPQRSPLYDSSFRQGSCC